MKANRILAGFLVLLLALGFMPFTAVAAFAAESAPVGIDLNTVRDNGSGYIIDWANGLLTITGDGNYRLTATDTTTTTRVIVQAANAHITLSSVRIVASTTAVPFSISPGSTVELTLEGYNMLKFDDSLGDDGAGLFVPDGAAVVIDGFGTLVAEGRKTGAGIGGMSGSINAGSITVNSGVVEATGGTYSAGIGGGNENNGTISGNGGTIIINGGNVTSTGGSHASGIGGACRGDGGSITINGGTVTAIGGSGSAGIGGGFTGDTGDIRITGGLVTATAVGIGSGIGRAPGGALSGGGSTGGGTIVISGGTVFAKAAGSGMPGLGSWVSQTDEAGTSTDSTTLKITGGSVRPTPGLIVRPDGADTAPIYLTTVTLQGTDVSGKEMYYTMDGSDPAGVRTDESGKLYFWLTEGAHALALIIDGQKYEAALTVGASDSNPYTLSITPDPAFVPISEIGWMGANGPEAIVGVPLNLSGTLEITPHDATYDSIVWSVEDAGGTGASVNESVLSALSPGTLQLKATVKRFGVVLKSWTASVNVKATAGVPDPGEQFSLALGGTYYFDLSGQGIEGTLGALGDPGHSGSLNPSLPDGSLHWVPFTYTGTVNAYSRTSSGVSTVGDVTVSDRSLFVANYNVAQAAPWDSLNSDGLIFGKDYGSGGVSYKLRSLSVGSGFTGTEHGDGDATRGVPASNEWDQILNKGAGFIKNWWGLHSLGQDTFSSSPGLYGARGEIPSPRHYYAIFGGANHSLAGFRPALEITSSLGTELKTVTYSMNGKGTLGDGGLTSATVVYTGALTLPQVTAEKGFTYTGAGGAGSLGWYAGSTFYAPDTEKTLPTGTILTLGYDPAANALTGTAAIDNTSPKIGDTLTGSLTGGNNTGMLSYIWKANGVRIGTGESYTTAAADLGKTITLEITSSVETGRVTSAATAAVTKKAAPPAPGVPELDTKTLNSVTLKANVAYEFSKDGIIWQTSNVFTGLTAGTAYTFYQRIAATSDTEESAASAKLDITTDAAPVVSAAISPERASYDLASPADISTNITWNSASAVTGVEYNGADLETSKDYYTVSDDTALIIRQGYLATQGFSEGDEAEFRISFDKGAHAVFTVDIVNNYLPGTNADLDNLAVGGSTVDEFRASETGYDVELPYGTQPGSAAAAVSAAAADPKARVAVTQAASLPGDATVRVTAEDGITQKTYTVHFTLEAAPPDAVYTVTFNLNGGTRTGGGELTQAVAQGGSATAPAVARNGYTFTGWNKTFADVSSDLTVTAVWSKNSSGSGGGGGHSPSTPGASGIATGQKTDPPAVVSAPALTFTDTANHWAKESIDFVTNRGLISGTSTTLFSPDIAITRADFLMALGRLSGVDVSGYETSGFTDVKSADSSMPYIEWAVKNKIVQGIGNSKFGPDQQISRQDMAVMIQNYAKAVGYKLPVPIASIAFSDHGKIAVYAKDAVTAIQQAGIMQGKGNNVFDPAGKATRAEASVILRRFVELVSR